MPRLLDLFCGAGGAAYGYHLAGFDEIVGVDIKPQPRYPFEFIQADALEFPTNGFDAIHASPPCQAYSDLKHRTGRDYPDLIEPIRDLLWASGLPYVIENVEGAPLVEPLLLCGTMFPALKVLRHRLFESNVPMLAPGDHPKHPLVHTKDKRKDHYGQPYRPWDYVSVNGGGNSTVQAAAVAMGIGWMTKAELNEAIPPAYTRWVGLSLIRAIERAA